MAGYRLLPFKSRWIALVKCKKCKLLFFVRRRNSLLILFYDVRRDTIWENYLKKTLMKLYI